MINVVHYQVSRKPRAEHKNNPPCNAIMHNSRLLHALTIIPFMGGLEFPPFNTLFQSELITPPSVLAAIKIF